MNTLKRIGLVLLILAFLAGVVVLMVLALMQSWFMYVLGAIAVLSLIMMAVALSFKIWPNR